MSLDTAVKSSEAQTFDLEREAPLLFAFVEQLKKSVDPKFLSYIEASILTPRHPTIGESKSALLPTADSAREQLLSLVAQDPGVIDRLETGYVFKTDGNKTQLVSQLAGEHAGDAYIIANLEITLQVAKILGCDVVFGIYSGDESTGLLIPRQGTRPPSEATINLAYQQASSRYYKKNPQTASYFAAIQRQVDDHTIIPFAHTDLPFDIHVDFKKISDAKVREPSSDVSHYRERTLFAGWIDNAENRDTSKLNFPLLNAIKDTLLHPRQSIHDRYSEHDRATWPQATQALYAQALKDFTGDKLNTALAYLELSVYEPLFGGDLLVRKFQNLKSDAESTLKRGHTLDLIRFADVRIKDVNTNSHLLGDYHMIATVRSIQNLFKSHGIDPHQNLKFYQHHGSFVLTVETNPQDTTSINTYSQIVDLLSDPLALNQELLTNEIAYGKLVPRNQHIRAIPYIVATPFVYDDEGNPSSLTLTNQTDLDNLFKPTGGETISRFDAQKRDQIIGETTASYALMGMGNILPDFILGKSSTRKNQTFSAPTELEISDEILSVLKILVDIFPRYILHRPARTSLLSPRLYSQLESALHRVGS